MPRQKMKFQLHSSIPLPQQESLGPRLGTLNFGDISIETPCFMPVGTQGVVKTLTPRDMQEIGYNLILGNTYHLFLRPGMEVISHYGSLHQFANWPGVILTDSGGFQVMSLAKMRKITEEGVAFQSHLDGSHLFLSPEKAVEIQETLDSDIHMVLDECTPYPADEETARQSMQRSMRWAQRCRDVKKKENRAQFGIVQGGMYPHLRKESAEQLTKIGFEGYGIGGLSVGESKKEMRDMLAATLPYLPKDQPRYLMGVGAPDDLVDCVLLGVDMFDCVMPTRNARNGCVFVRTKAAEIGKILIKNQEHRLSNIPLDSECSCYTCKNFSRGYLRHLFNSQELTVFSLLTLHNLTFLSDLMKELRQAIQKNDLSQIADIRSRYVASN